MAQPLIKFFRVASLPPTGTPGALYFVSGEGVLYVCTSEKSFEAYAGIKAAALDGSVLTLTPSVGKAIPVDIAALAQAAVDLSEYAKTEAVNTAISNAINAEVKRANDAYDEKGAADAALAAAKEYADGLPHVNTTYTFAEGTVNGEFVVTPSDGTAQQVKVHGLGDAAYTTVAALESTMDSKDQAIAAAAATDAQGKADKALADAKAWVEEQEYVTASIIDGLATEKYVDGAVKAEADIARAAEEALGKRIDDLAAAAVSVKEDTINHVKVTKSGTEYTVEGVDIASKSVVDTLIGDDKAMSARAIVQDEVAKQLTSENISDSFDTLKEMAEWLSSHPEDVKEMNDAIGANKTAIEAEVLRATTAEGNLQTAIANEESARKAAIDALDFNEASTGGSKVTVNVTQVDGKITGVTVAESDIASAQALATLNTEVQEHEEVVAATLNDLNERINAVDGRIPTELGVMSVAKGTDGNFVTTTVDNTDAANPKVSVAVDYVDGATAGDKLTTNTYVDEHIAAAINAIPAAHVTDVVGDSASYSVVEAPEAGGVHTVKNTLATITVDDDNKATVTEGLATDAFVKTYVENQLSWASF